MKKIVPKLTSISLWVVLMAATWLFAVIFNLDGIIGAAVGFVSGIASVLISMKLYRFLNTKLKK